MGQIVGAQNNAGPAVSMKRCLMCAIVVRATTQPLICAGCQIDCHKSCYKLSRVDHLASGTWTCDICNNAQTNNGLVNTGQPQDNVVRRAEVRSRSSLKVLRWNANGLKSKMVDLEDRIRHTKIDLIMIQESKLCSKDWNPSLPVYSIIRKDREFGRGEGLITFIKEDIPFTFKINQDSQRESLLEMLKVKICDASLHMITCANVYCPPARGALQGQEVY